MAMNAYIGRNWQSFVDNLTFPYEAKGRQLNVTTFIQTNSNKVQFSISPIKLIYISSSEKQDIIYKYINSSYGYVIFW